MIYEYFNWDIATIAGLAWGTLFVILVVVAVLIGRN